MIITVVCDFGGVLTTPLWDAFVAYSEHCGIPLEAFWAALGDLNARDGVNPMAELECGRLSERAFTGSLGDQIAVRIGRPVDISDFSEVWFGHLHPNPEMWELMRSLRDRDLNMAILTNNVREWERHWRPRMPVDEVFATVIDSGFVGLRKPDPAIYRLTEQRVAATGAEILFIDDMDVNIAAARDAGWQTVHFIDNHQAVAAIRAAVGLDRADSVG